MKWLSQLAHDELIVQEDHDLTSYSTMRLKSQGDLIIVKGLGGLTSFIKASRSQGVPYGVLGWGANQPLPKKATKPYIKLEFPFDRSILEHYQPSYLLPASVSLAMLTSAAVRLGLSGWEVFSGIPASLGGAVAMNAGTGLGEISSLVERVDFVTCEGELQSLEVVDSSFSYRKNHFLKEGDVIYQVLLKNHGQSDKVAGKIREYLAYRNRTQPMQAWTCGCMFKNHESCRAGETLDRMGYKGFTYKNLRVSPVHANFMENLGDATLDEVRELLELLNDEVFKRYGIRFEPEIKI